MPSDLTVFISSTVEDLGPVRASLARRLRSRGYIVRTSESSDFPVEPGVTSHDACLAAVRKAHIFVLLVGQRYGGDYLDQNKSITWREWEEARAAGLVIVSLVTKEANDSARKIFIERKRLAAQKVQLDEAQLSARLAKVVPDKKPFVQRMVDVQRFIDVVRKGHVDNWVHTDWSGTADGAMSLLDRRLGSALAALWLRDRERDRLVAMRKEQADGVWAVIERSAQKLQKRRTSGNARVDDGAQELLKIIAEHRNGLFQFGERDIYNLMLYRRSGQSLIAGPRVAHSSLRVSGRKWRLGEGHVGRAVLENRVLVTGDLRQTPQRTPGGDRASEIVDPYVSAVSIPLKKPGAQSPFGAFIVTSSRVDHFRDDSQPEVAIARGVASLLGALWEGSAAKSSAKARSK